LWGNPPGVRIPLAPPECVYLLLGFAGPEGLLINAPQVAPCFLVW